MGGCALTGRQRPGAGNGAGRARGGGKGKGAGWLGPTHAAATSAEAGVPADTNAPGQAEGRKHVARGWKQKGEARAWLGCENAGGSPGLPSRGI